MASSTRTKGVNSFNTSGNPIAFQLNVMESTKRIPQPVFADEAVIKIWQRRMLIPFVIDRKLVAFHGPLPDSKSAPKVVQGFSLVILLLPLHLSTRMDLSMLDS